MTTTTKVAVLIPSHISYEGQIDLLDRCINSLVNQTIKSDIYVSLSFSNDTYKNEFSKNILVKYWKIVKFFLSKKQLFQMEHILNLNYRIEKKYDMFMFCDDDDTYNKVRVEKFICHFEWMKHNFVEENTDFGGVREKMDIKGMNYHLPEYWAHGIKPDVLKDYFVRIFNENKNILLKHKFSDMFFRLYLNKNNKYGLWSGIDYREVGGLYHYNISNPNSICGSLIKKAGCMFDNMLVETINCYSDNDFEKIKKKTIYKEYKKDFSQMKEIYMFCKSLYT